MELSVFLAKVIGLYMLIIGLVVLKKPGLQGVINELSKEHDLRFVLSVFSLIIGLLLVVSHNIWSGPAYVVVITIVSWIALLKSLASLWMSDDGYKKLLAKFGNKNMMTVAGIVNIVVGIYLTYVGFFT
jgi:hypothetical protein